MQPTDTTEVAQAKVQKQLENGRRFDTAEAEAEILTRLSGTLSDAYSGAQTPAEIMSRVNFSFHEPTAEQIAKTVDRSLEQEAWHGTPNEIVGDQLSTDYIGSGEGAQVHGHGLYVALSEDIAKYNYQYRLSGDQATLVLSMDGEPLRRTMTDPSYFEVHNAETGRWEPLDANDPAFKTQYLTNEGLQAVANTIDILQDNYNRYRNDDFGRPPSGQYKEDIIDSLEEHVRYARDDVARNPNDAWYRRTLKYYEAGLKAAERINFKTLRGGQRLRLEIPEDRVMLREDARFSEQPEFVQKQLRQVFTDNKIPFTDEAPPLRATDYTEGSWRYDEPIDKVTPNSFGRQIYHFIASHFGDDIHATSKDASRLLDKYGIKGIRYNGSRDGECAVLFDGKYAKILERFFDQQGRGRIDFLNDGTIRIIFTDAADASTAIHEFQHFFLSEAGRLLSDPTVAESAAKQMLAKDIETLGRWAGEKENLSDPRLWSAEAHEKLAKAFEQYFREGKAPTPEMQSLFQKMKNLLVELYKKAKDLIGLSRLPKDIREVFDRELTGYKAEETRNSKTAGRMEPGTESEILDTVFIKDSRGNTFRRVQSRDETGKLVQRVERKKDANSEWTPWDDTLAAYDEGSINYILRAFNYEKNANGMDMGFATYRASRLAELSERIKTQRADISRLERELKKVHSAKLSAEERAAREEAINNALAELRSSVKADEDLAYHFNAIKDAVPANEISSRRPEAEASVNAFDPERTLQSMGAVRDRLDFIDEDVLTKLMKDKDVFLAEDKAERLLARKALGEKLKPAEDKQVKALLKAMDYDSIELPPGELVNIRKQYGKAKEQGLDVSEAELLTKKTEDAQRKVNDDPACGV